jgi:hypothetical protein
MLSKSVICFLIILAIFSCNSDYTIRQRGYFKIDLPEHKYVTFNKPDYPYTFEYPAYSNVVRDSTFFEDKPENPFWVNIEFPSLNGKIYMSYKDVTKNQFDNWWMMHLSLHTNTAPRLPV